MRYHSIQLLTVLLILSSSAQELRAQETMRALSRAETAYRGIETLRADFVQTLHNPMLGGEVVSTGVLLLAPPSKFAM